MSEDVVAGVVQMYAERAGMSVAFTNALPGRLIHASRHRFGRMVETVVAAIGQALGEGAATLTPMHFALSWGAQEGCGWDENVFVARDWAAIDPDVRAAEVAIQAASWSNPIARSRSR